MLLENHNHHSKHPAGLSWPNSYIKCYNNSEDQKRVCVVDYDRAPTLLRRQKVEEDIDEEAENFIKLEHKRFNRSMTR